MEKRINTPFTYDALKDLKIGDKVLISGFLYTARDAAHKKFIDGIEKGEELPFEIQGQCIYYVGPCPAKEPDVIGSAGPTTSYRMDDYTPVLLDKGLKGMIGKGKRNENVISSIKKNKAVYFVAIGGAAAVIANCIKSVEPVAYPELLSEAVTKIFVEDMPVYVAIDSDGNNIYKN